MDLDRVVENDWNDENCTNNYIPSTEEYLGENGLGLYGTWLMIVGGCFTLLLYIVFFEQVFFSQRGAHRVFRRHIYWIASVYPFMTMMSLASVIVPRAHNICTAVKVTYMSIGITHFVDLTILMYGSEEVMMAKTEGQRMTLQVGPACCCCKCLPSPQATKSNLRLTIWMSDQLPFTQAFYYILLLVLIAGNNITLGDVAPSNAYLWLVLMNMTSFMSGVWALQILSTLSKDHLRFYNYEKKSFSMKTLVLVTNFQSFILAIMGNYNVFPCKPPYIPPQVFRQTVENSLYFVEMLLLGCYTYYQYHNHEFITPNPTEVPSTNEEERKDHRSGTVRTTITRLSDSSDLGNEVESGPSNHFERTSNFSLSGDDEGTFQSNHNTLSSPV